MENINIYAVQEIGIKIIYSALSNANFAITHSNNGLKNKGSRYRQGLEDLKMLSDGELERIIEFFGLNLEPEDIKTGFYNYVKKTPCR
jgi:hypothetical protein